MPRFLHLWWIPAALVCLASQSAPEATYEKGIRPILEKKCVACHAENGHGPFPLQTYAQTRKRGDLIRLVSLTGQMPPTDAMSDLGTVSPHAPLTPNELQSIQEWFRLGMPEGKPTPPLPSVARIAPLLSDHVVFAQVGKGTVIPAEGRTARTVYRLPDMGFGYFGGFLFQPDSPQAVRQVAVAIQRPGQLEPFTSTGIRPGALVATWAPGFYSWGSSSGGAFRVQRGDRLWVQVRATPTGKPESAGGLFCFGREYKEGKIQTKTLGNTSIDIPAETQTRLHDEWILDRDIELISIFPEARFTTEQVRVTATINGEEKLLLVVLTWDATWPGAYNFKTPVKLPKGTKIAYEALINNSKHGHAAEGEKTRPIKFGPSPENEIFWCHLQYISR